MTAWVVSRPRPDLPVDERDWPNGAAEDAAYPTLGGSGEPGGA